MNARNLIELARSKNLGISRARPGVYETHRVIDGKHVTQKHAMTWAQFVAYIKSL